MLSHETTIYLLGASFGVAGLGYFATSQAVASQAELIAQFSVELMTSARSNDGYLSI